MRIFKDKFIQSHHEQVCVGLQCDMCGRKSESWYCWTSEPYEINETEISMKTTIEHRHGVSFPE